MWINLITIVFLTNLVLCLGRAQNYYQPTTAPPPPPTYQRPLLTQTKKHMKIDVEVETIILKVPTTTPTRQIYDIQQPATESYLNRAIVADKIVFINNAKEQQNENHMQQFNDRYNNHDIKPVSANKFNENQEYEMTNGHSQGINRANYEGDTRDGEIESFAYRENQQKSNNRGQEDGDSSRNGQVNSNNRELERKPVNENEFKLNHEYDMTNGQNQGIDRKSDNWKVGTSLSREFYREQSKKEVIKQYEVYERETERNLELADSSNNGESDNWKVETSLSRQFYREQSKKEMTKQYESYERETERNLDRADSLNHQQYAGDRNGEINNNNSETMEGVTVNLNGFSRNQDYEVPNKRNQGINRESDIWSEETDPSREFNRPQNVKENMKQFQDYERAAERNLERDEGVNQQFVGDARNSESYNEDEQQNNNHGQEVNYRNHNHLVDNNNRLNVERKAESASNQDFEVSNSRKKVTNRVAEKDIDQDISFNRPYVSQRPVNTNNQKFEKNQISVSEFKRNPVINRDSEKKIEREDKFNGPNISDHPVNNNNRKFETNPISMSVFNLNQDYEKPSSRNPIINRDLEKVVDREDKFNRSYVSDRPVNNNIRKFEKNTVSVSEFKRYQDYETPSSHNPVINRDTEKLNDRDNGYSFTPNYAIDHKETSVFADDNKGRQNLNRRQESTDSNRNQKSNIETDRVSEFNREGEHEEKKSYNNNKKLTIETDRFYEDREYKETNYHYQGPELEESADRYSNSQNHYAKTNEHHKQDFTAADNNRDDNKSLPKVNVKPIRKSENNRRPENEEVNSYKLDQNKRPDSTIMLSHTREENPKHEESNESEELSLKPIRTSDRNQNRDNENLNKRKGEKAPQNKLERDNVSSRTQDHNEIFKQDLKPIENSESNLNGKRNSENSSKNKEIVQKQGQGKNRRLCEKKYSEYIERIFRNDEQTTADANDSEFDGRVLASPGEYPHMTAVGFRNDDNSIDYRCGGSLISENFVITAAHCTNLTGDIPTIARIGDVNLMVDEKHVEPQVYRIRRIHVHPQYDGETHYNDIALLQLNASVEFTEFVRPIRLWSHADLPILTAYAMGYGATSFTRAPTQQLTDFNMTIIANDECNERLPQLDEVPLGIIESLICAEDLVMHRDTCQGDSGGPLQYNLRGKRRKNRIHYQLIGITSFGLLCRSPNPGVYTRIYSYLDWIERIAWSGY